ncbi:hypothetical protein FNV43_RR16653 [Rhamnella rubrinervis]|uniref:Uncharacterized protein n=1 Tax=Rhamnella rubrinervis TaxID=2594499 RepID=A0A8K0GZ77_9ROSA|nr:hypothetical protein FNV43_RR16653 [Rhamnella rubrinervis]
MDQEMKMGVRVLFFLLLGLVSTIYMILRSAPQIYPLTIHLHSFVFSNATSLSTQGGAMVVATEWDFELTLARNSDDLRVFFQGFESFVYYQDRRALRCAWVRPIEIEKWKRPNKLSIRLDMTSCNEELSDNQQVLKELSLRMNMEVGVTFQFGRTRIWPWLRGRSVEHSCTQVTAHHFQSVNMEDHDPGNRLVSEGGTICSIPLPVY